MSGSLEHRLGRVRPDPVVVPSQPDRNDAVERGLAGHDERRAVDVGKLAFDVERRHHPRAPRHQSRREEVREHGGGVLRRKHGA